MARHDETHQSTAPRLVPRPGRRPHRRRMAGRVFPALPRRPHPHLPGRSRFPDARRVAARRHDPGPGRVPRRRDVRSPPHAAVPRGDGGGGEGRRAAAAARDGDQLRPPRAVRVAGGRRPVRGGGLAGRGRGAAGGLAGRPLPPEPGRQPEPRPHRRHRPVGPADGPLDPTGRLDRHPHRGLRRGRSRQAPHRPARGRADRRPARPRAGPPRRARLHLPAAQPLRRGPPGVRRALPDGGGRATGGRRPRPVRSVADHHPPARHDGDRAAREPPLRDERRRQARHGRAVGDRRHRNISPAHGGGGAAREVGQPGAGAVPPGAVLPQRPAVPHVEVPHHAPGRRGERPGDDGPQRPAADAPRGRSSGRPTWTSCRSCSTSSPAT